MDKIDVAIVGGGAAGLATAIFCAHQQADLRIAILDGAKKLGAKILVSGGGRCNVTNVRVMPEDFWGGSRNTIRRILRSFTEKQTAEFFHKIGVPLHEENWGKLFPDSNSAKTVLHALLDEARRVGVKILPGHRVVDTQKVREFFRIDVQSPGTEAHGSSTSASAVRLSTSMTSEPLAPTSMMARNVVLATGGKSLPKTGSDGLGIAIAQSLGHTIVPTTPALAPLILEGEFHQALSGVSQETELFIAVEGEKGVRICGPMLWTHFGVSGPAALDASRHWHRAVLEKKTIRLTASFVPGQDFAAVEQKLLSIAQVQPRSSIKGTLGTFVSASLAQVLCIHAGCPERLELGQLTREQRRGLIHAMLEFPLHVKDSRGYGFAEVTAGGVALDEIDPATMQSRKCRGLFLVGEILDVDGRIGGFNFQWAWSSAYVAGRGIAKVSGIKP